MIARVERLLEEALRLPQEARAALASSLIRSLDDEVDENAETAWAAEIDRRLDRLDLGRVKTVPWSKVRQSILNSRRARPRG